MIALKKALPWLRDRWEAAVAVVLVAIAVVVFVKLASHIDRPIVDDAVISIAFGRSLFDGHGLRATPYSQIVEGFSNPTWTFLLGVLEKLGVNSMRPAKTLGLGLAGLSLPLLLLWGPVSQKRRIQVEDAIAPLFICTNASLVYWALGGLESGLLVFLLALFGLLLFAPRSRRVAIGLGLTAAALTLTRPEGALYVGVGALPWLVDALIAKRLRFRPTREDGVAVAAFVLPVLGYVLFRRLYFGAWLPNTYYAKHAWFIGLHLEKELAAYLQTFVEATQLLFILAGVGLALSLAGGRRTAKSAFVAALFAGSMFFFTWYVTADWMKEWRFLSPSIPFVCYPIAAGAHGVRALLERAWFRDRRRLRFGIRAVVYVLLGIGIFSTGKRHEARWAEVKAKGGDVPSDPNLRAAYGNDLREMISSFRMTHPLVAGPDMGWLSIGMRDAEIIDLAGLADVTIARHYGNPKAMRDYFTQEGMPTVLMVWGPSNYLWSMDILQSYQGSSYKVYAKVSATSDERCPLGKASALEDNADQMIENVLRDLRARAAVKALAAWRCYLTYRTDADLPTPARRVEVARTAESLAREAEQGGDDEPALRAYSLCAVIGASSYSPSVSCRFQAERLRGRLFPRSKKSRR